MGRCAESNSATENGGCDTRALFMQDELTATRERRIRPQPHKARRSPNLRVRARWGRTGVIVALILVWEITTRLGLVDKDFVSTPLRVLAALGQMLRDPVVLSALSNTGTSILLAFLLGTAIGIAAGTVMGLSKTLWDAYMSPLLFLLSTPKSIFLPIFILLYGIGPTSAIFFGAFEAFVFVALNVAAGMALVDSRHLTVARAFKASRSQTLLAIIFPSALPGIFTALWYGIRHAFTGVLIAELWASSEGVGALIRVYAEQLHTDKTLALMLAMTAIAILAGAVWNQIEARLTRWRQDPLGSETAAVKSEV